MRQPNFASGVHLAPPSEVKYVAGGAAGFVVTEAKAILEFTASIEVTTDAPPNASAFSGTTGRPVVWGVIHWSPPSEVVDTLISPDGATPKTHQSAAVATPTVGAPGNPRIPTAPPGPPIFATATVLSVDLAVQLIPPSLVVSKSTVT